MVRAPRGPGPKGGSFRGVWGWRRSTARRRSGVAWRDDPGAPSREPYGVRAFPASSLVPADRVPRKKPDSTYPKVQPTAFD
jgi:hypothetical protein